MAAGDEEATRQPIGILITDDDHGSQLHHRRDAGASTQAAADYEAVVYGAPLPVHYYGSSIG